MEEDSTMHARPLCGRQWARCHRRSRLRAGNALPCNDVDVHTHSRIDDGAQSSTRIALDNQRSPTACSLVTLNRRLAYCRKEAAIAYQHLSTLRKEP
jgi:hypothetical protein